MFKKYAFLEIEILENNKKIRVGFKMCIKNVFLEMESEKNVI